MSDYYHQFLSSMAGVGDQIAASPQDASPPNVQYPPVMGVATTQPAPGPYPGLGYFANYPEAVMFNASKSQRGRRRSAPGLDHIKHRRTRSGCFTCRGRRVKCDEKRPVCDRCRKGKRECIYPEPPAPKGLPGSQPSRETGGTSRHSSPAASNDGEVDEDDYLDDEAEANRDLRLEPIADEDEPDDDDAISLRSKPSNQLLRRAARTGSFRNQPPRLVTGKREESETPSLEGKSSSPSVSTGTGSSFTPAAALLPDLASIPPAGSRPDWSHLSQELQFYLAYFCDNITHYHYSMVTDPDDFFRFGLPSLALRNEALLYAVVGFSAYNYTLTNPTGEVNDFLQYYNKSVMVLLRFLRRKEKHNVYTLLTILQLAAIEEYLGDWVNLMGHQKAALEVLNGLFRPESVMDTGIGRIAISWYARFDVFVGIMSGYGTALEREWFTSMCDYYEREADANSDNVSLKIEVYSMRLRQISMDMSMLLGQMATKAVTEDEFGLEHNRLSSRLHEWRQTWDPALEDPKHLVTSFPTERPPRPEDIVDPFAPGVLYGAPLFASTILQCEWHSIVIMHESQAMKDSAHEASAQEAPAAIREHAMAVCRIFETIEYWPFSPRGSLIIIQPCITIANLFLPRDSRHHMWMRRKFALLESMGYIFPQTMRARMAEFFHDLSCVRWWLPNDEGYTPILRSIRHFADERNATAVTAQAENLREIRHVFAKMALGNQAGLAGAIPLVSPPEDLGESSSQAEARGPMDPSF